MKRYSNQGGESIENQNSASDLYQGQIAAEKKTTIFLIFGWISAALSLISPAIGTISIISGVLTIKYHRKLAGSILIITTLVFIGIGLTGSFNDFITSFAEGFVAGVEGK
ncbi:hypothetical protein FC89_GL000696 [Liquorilactobacillus ghanensis DSM 18630]|uniref:Uncharacterized protein n=1 Tax=Liquorilactobacillus ghanensis DSM 18630 TaxID=1423750 RepID=A0A0R1VU93_9LACO|nr:hypothetical protein [Liquorilactobacillus ghanensis]KRM06547.1 hypothetical protein FC89_GL000696 [Liquorilactobacillus ghanensis DSM 18630]